MHFSALKAAALAAIVSLGLVAPAAMAAEQTPPPRYVWSWTGPFGQFDRAQLQRGFQVYKEVCAACHSLDLVSFRNLSQRGGPEFTPEQAAQIAADWQHKVRELNDAGEMIERAARLADRIPGPFPNRRAAAAANGGTMPPDLSLMPKARTYERGFPWWIIDIFTMYQENGADYLKAFLVGYKDPPAGKEPPAGLNYNTYFPGNFVAMPNMLQDGLVTYADGTPQTAEQYSRDVTAFLMWSAEPHLEQRKRMGFQVILFLIVLTGLLYFTKKRVWKSVHA